MKNLHDVKTFNNIQICHRNIKKMSSYGWERSGGPLQKPKINYMCTVSGVSTYYTILVTFNLNDLRVGVTCKGVTQFRFKAN